MFDSHCHLTDERFAADVDAVIDRAWDAGLDGLVTIASDAADARAALALARRHPRIRATAGVHPHVAQHATDAALDDIRDLLADDAVVAIGETGLDYHYDNSPRSVQRRLFEWHLATAAALRMPLVVHSRSADADMAAAIAAAPGITGVLHCFSGSASLLDAALAADWYVSFAGMVSFRNFDAVDLLRAVPADRLLIETDSPYLAPVPHRGRRNEPAYVVETCRAVAAHLGQSAAAVASRTTANAQRFYGIGRAS